MTRLWIVTEGMAGTENQCLGVADALGIPPEVKRIALHQPWKSLTPYLGFEQSWSFIPPLHGPWPDILLTSGRKAIAASRYIKKQNPGTFTVHIQDPKISPNYFNLIAVPFHDGVRGEAVIVTDGAPNRITPEKLFKATHPAPSQKKCVGVLIGGNSKTHKLTDAIMQDIVTQLRALAGDYKLLVTVSRRTGVAQAKILKDALADTDAFIWDGNGNNPYFGILAYSDYLLVTNDSASMISEAATTGKPVYLLPLEGRSAKFDTLYHHMKKIGAARDFSGILENWAYAPLTDAQKIAGAIRKALGSF